MIFKAILSLRYKPTFKLITYLLVFSLMLTISGCTTTDTQRVRSDDLTYKIDYEIINVIMKNGLVINLRGKSALYVKEFNDKKNLILYSTTDTVRVSEDSTRVYSINNIIELSEVKEVTIEKSETNVGLTILATLGIIAAFIVILAIIAFATKESCPFIYSFDGNKYVFDAEPYGGAVTEGLKKTDYSKLEYLKPVNGKYKLLVRNEADETQHTDEMKLLVIDHALNTEVTPDINGSMTVYEKIHTPISVTDENGNDVTSFLTLKDNLQWQSNLPSDSLSLGENLRHKLIFKFPRPKDAKTVKLFVNGGTAMWGGYMIKSMLELRGNKVDDWYENIDNKGTEYLKLYQFMEREELYTLKINVFKDDNWIEKGYINGGGPFLFEDRVIELNIENIPGDTLTIGLNPPLGFWKIDRVGVIYSEFPKPEINELSVSYAEDQDGNDLVKSLSSSDGNYYDMPELDNCANIYFDALPQKKDTKRTLYLKTNGYYDIHLKKDKPEQTELIEKIMNTPGLIVKYAMAEYLKKIKQLEAKK